ncbi:MAG: YitT family protein [Clostridia bacterium]|nr:YitT family protein [Clostridia bacterium]
MSNKKKGISKATPYILDFLFIFVGCAVLAAGINLFLAPNMISSGGISSVGTILLHLFGVDLWITNLAANVLLFLLGFRFLGKYAVMKTTAGILFLSMFLWLSDFLPKYTEDKILATVVGGVLVGLGVGLVVRRDGSTGGSDFAALMIKRFLPHVSIANLILVMDCAVILLSGIVFKSVSVTIYSVIAMYISSKITDWVVLLGDAAKSVQILSPKNEEIAAMIMEKFERGVTGVHCTGMYTGKDGLMLMCLVSPKELPKLANAVRKIDPSCFMVIGDAREVLGMGFKEKSDYDQIK